MQNSHSSHKIGRLKAWFRRRWNSWLTCTVLSVVLIAYIAWQQGAFSGCTQQQLLRIACDGCFICALIFLVLYVIALCLRNGAFSYFRYGAASMMDSFSRRKGEAGEKRYENYADYLKKSSVQKRKSPALLVFGLGFLLFGFISLLLYMK